MRLIAPSFSALLAVSCILDPPKDPPPKERRFISFKAPDALLEYDTVRVRLIRDGDTVETLWNAPLPDLDSLDSLETETYDGGRMDVLVEGLRQDDIQYRVLVRLTGEDRAPEVERLALPADRSPPILVLKGPDSLRLLLGEPYVDSGASCRDLRDGDLEPDMDGAVRTDSAGEYDLIYRCRDAAGNEADPVSRAVKVEDTTSASLTLKGPAGIAIRAGGALTDTGAVCAHPRRGDLPVATEGKIALDTPGVYTLRYTCEVRPGQIGAVSQEVLVKPVRVEIPIFKEAEIDTARYVTLNMGFNPSGAFLPAEGNEHVILMQFDLSGVELEGLKSAEAVFQTFGNGDWNGDSVAVTLHVYRVQSPWIEGTGNWFWHSGRWWNSGATVFMHYPLSDSVKLRSTDPADETGVTGMQKALVRKSNLISMGARTVTVAYDGETSFHPTLASFVPSGDKLTPLAVDFTDYVKSVPAGRDFGFVIVAEDLAASKHISWLTKEAGDGSFGARLILRY